MPLYTADALVLRTYKLGEADRIVVFLTRDRGKKRGVAKGARRHRSPFVGALEPLTEVRVAYFESERRELVGLNYAETVRSPLILAGLRGGPYDRGPEGPPLRHDRGSEGPPLRHDRGSEGPPLRHDRGPEGPPLRHDRGSEGPPLRHDRGPEGPPLRHDRGPERPTGSDRRGGPSGPQEFNRSGQFHAAQAAQDALGYIGYFAELLDEWAQDADADDRLYRLGASMLDALAAGAPAEPLARYFEYWLLRLQGVYPEARGSLSAGALSFLAASRSVPPHQVGDVPANDRVLTELEAVHRALITMHLEKTLKSDRVLRDLRNGVRPR